MKVTMANGKGDWESKCEVCKGRMTRMVEMVKGTSIEFKELEKES